jgi:hypothetical protein
VRVVVALGLLVACDAGEKKASPPAQPPAPPPSRDVPRPNTRVGNAIMGSECTETKLRTHGVESSPRIVDATGCSLLANPTEGGGEIWVLFAMPATSAAQLAHYVRCTAPPRVDWERDQLVVLGYQMGEIGEVRSVFDNGTTQTLVFTVGNRQESADPMLDYALAFALVPSDRKIDFVACPLP